MSGPTGHRRASRLRPAAGSPSKPPSASAILASPRWMSSRRAAALFDCSRPSARLAASAPSSGAGQEARPNSSNTSMASRSPVVSAPSAPRPWPASSRQIEAMAAPSRALSTARSAGQRLASNSRTDLRSKSRSVPERPSSSVGWDTLMELRPGAGLACRTSVRGTQHRFQVPVHALGRPLECAPARSPFVNPRLRIRASSRAIASGKRRASSRTARFRRDGRNR